MKILCNLLLNRGQASLKIVYASRPTYVYQNINLYKQKKNTPNLDAECNAYKWTHRPCMGDNTSVPIAVFVHW